MNSKAIRMLVGSLGMAAAGLGMAPTASAVNPKTVTVNLGAPTNSGTAAPGPQVGDSTTFRVDLNPPFLAGDLVIITSNTTRRTQLVVTCNTGSVQVASDTNGGNLAVLCPLFTFGSTGSGTVTNT